MNLVFAPLNEKSLWGWNLSSRSNTPNFDALCAASQPPFGEVITKSLFVSAFGALKKTLVKKTVTAS
jgi:hypothetical protein